MNDTEIENLLRKAPPAKIPEGLLEKLQADVILPRVATEDSGANDWLLRCRAWFPRLSFGLLLLTGLIALAVQTRELANQKQENTRLRASTANLESLRRQNTERQQLRAAAQQSEQFQKEKEELLKLRAEVAQLRAATQELPALRAESVRLQTERAAVLAAATTANEPHIQFSETGFDFGQVTNTEALTHEFVFFNTGSAILEIISVVPGCGCTTAGEWDRQVPPGKSGKIPVRFNPATFQGPVSKSITVTCNDPSQRTHYLQIKANVWRPIEVRPSSVYFLRFDDQPTNETKVVRIINWMEEDLVLQPPQSDNPEFQTDLRIVRPGKEFELLITCGGTVHQSEQKANIRIDTSAAGAPTLNVTASLRRQSSLVFLPSPIRLPAGPLRGERRFAGTIRNSGRTPVKVSDPFVNAGGVTVQMEETDPGRIFNVILVFPAGFQIQSGQTVQFAVKTTHPEHPLLQVPIVQGSSPLEVTPFARP